MPTQQFPIERNGPKRITLTWSGLWKEFTVKFDGTDVATISKEDLNAGKELSLPDGSVFKVHLRKVGMSTELQLLRNGQPLPGSGSDPAQLAKTAAGIIYFIAGYSALLGVIALVGRVEILLNLGFGVSTLVEAFIFAVLGFFTMQRSRIALGIAIFLYAADAIAGIAIGVSEGGKPGIGGIIFRVVLLTAMFRGFKALGELKAQEKKQVEPGSITSG